MVNAIAAEANRAKGATRQLIREGVAEILYNPGWQRGRSCMPSGAELVTINYSLPAQRAFRRQGS